MPSWIDYLFGSGSGSPSAKRKSAGDDYRDPPATMEDDSESGMRRQLVHVLLRDALRRHGIHPDWIGCNLLVVSSRRRGAGMYVRLILRHWDERLIRYMPAFQKVLQTDIERFEPRSSQWLHGVFWQFDVEDACPHKAMPNKEFWQAPIVLTERIDGATAKNFPPRMAASAPEAISPASPVNPVPTAVQLAEAVRQANAARRAAPTLVVAVERPAEAFAKTAPSRLGELYEAAGTPSPSGTPQRGNGAGDLDKMFAARDRELQAGPAHVDYQKTEPSGL